MIFSEKFILLVPSTANRRQFDPSGERARMIDFRKQQLFFMDPKESVFHMGFFLPSFSIQCCVNESKTGHLKTPKNGQKRSSRRNPCTDSRSSEFLDRVRTRAHAKRSIRISAFSSRKFISHRVPRGKRRFKLHSAKKQ